MSKQNRRNPNCSSADCAFLSEVCSPWNRRCSICFGAFCSYHLIKGAYAVVCNNCQRPPEPTKCFVCYGDQDVLRCVDCLRFSCVMHRGDFFCFLCNLKRLHLQPEKKNDKEPQSSVETPSNATITLDSKVLDFYSDLLLDEPGPLLQCTKDTIAKAALLRKMRELELDQNTDRKKRRDEVLHPSTDLKKVHQQKRRSLSPLKKKKKEKKR
jgi:hypothetical protein